MIAVSDTTPLIRVSAFTLPDMKIVQAAQSWQPVPYISFSITQLCGLSAQFLS